MHNRLLLFLLIALSFHSFNSFCFRIDTSKFKSIEKLILSKTVNAEISGTGGYSGDCMQIAIENNSSDSTFVWIEAGRRLGSEDSTMQDIWLAKNLTMALGPHQKDSIPVFGFCCQAHYKAPREKSKFNIGIMAPAAWVILANFVDQNVFPVKAVQNAIWVLSDGHQLSSIHDEDENKVAPLKRKVAQLLGIEVPWYSFTYLKEPNQLFSNKAEKIYGDINFYVNTNAIITIIIKDKYGANRHYVMREAAYGPGEYTLKLKSNIEGWEKGKYTVLVIQDYMTPIKKQSFVIK
jgi:hypothetical protein